MVEPWDPIQLKHVIMQDLTPVSAISATSTSAVQDLEEALQQVLRGYVELKLAALAAEISFGVLSSSPQAPSLSQPFLAIQPE